MMNFVQHLQSQEVSPELQSVLLALSDSVQDVATVIEKGGMLGKSESQNVFGEQQLRLDLAANDIVVQRLRESGVTSAIASEEMEEILTIDESLPFCVGMDPLDGSSLVDVNFSVGSIFGIYPGSRFIGRTGREQVAGLIAVYGPRTTFFCSAGKGLHEYMLVEGEFVLSQENVRIAQEGKYFAPGNLRACAKSKAYLKLLNFWAQEQYTLRYSGGMVPDINHIFKKGKGVFVYPGYEDAPRGKLRLLYECAPFAFLAEQGGGIASDGEQAILDQKIESLDQRTPIFIGSKSEVEKAVEMMKSAL